MKLLTPEQAANRLSISVTILNKQVRAGKLRVVSFSGDDPRQWRFTESELERFIKVNETYFEKLSEREAGVSVMLDSGPVEKEFERVFGTVKR